MVKNLLFTITKKQHILLYMLLFSIGVSAQCSLTGWKQFTQTEHSSIALKEDGTIWVWGNNTEGITGNGTAGGVIQHPIQVGTSTDWTEIAAGRFFVLAKKANGDLYGWGDNTWGNLGNGNNTDQYTPILIAQNVKAFSAGYHHTMIVKNDGTMWGTGYNEWGNLGKGDLVNSNTWQQEASLATDWTNVGTGYYASYGIKTNGTLWSVGSNVYGQTGTGATSGATSTFTQIGTDTNWKEATGGVYHALGLKTNGKLFGWGSGADGRLGIVGAGATIYHNPQAIEASSNYTYIATSWDASAIIKSDGTLYAMGVNHGGITGGVAASTNNLAPQQVGTDSNWKNLTLRVGGFHFGAVKNDTSIWAWGTDNLYQLGNGDGLALNTNVPTQVTCVDGQLGINEVIKTKIAIYPNPVKDVLNLVSDHKNPEVKIFSATGRLIKSAKVENKVINTTDLPKGVYFLKIQNESQGVKFIKE